MNSAPPLDSYELGVMSNCIDSLTYFTMIFCPLTT